MVHTNCEHENFLPGLRIKTKQFHIRNLYKTRKSTKTPLSNFSLIEETMDLPHIRLDLKKVRT